MPSLVALDIETTGLDPNKDAILEIGAVRFNGRRVEDEWVTFIQPGRRISPFITQLTGIDDYMVAKAPPLQAVLADLSAFIGNSALVGHAIRFDLSFLRRSNILHLNDALDTYEMAAILLPRAGRYSLAALASELGVLHTRPHRALPDAQATHHVFIRLLEMATELPIDLLAEIVRLGEGLDWYGYGSFREALRSRSRETIKARRTTQEAYGPLFAERPRQGTALQPNAEQFSLEPDDVAAYLEHGGAFSRHFPAFEYRPEQVAMLRAVTTGLCEGRHLLVEAGTGVGKSLAYLIPAALWAVQNNTRVVVSTNTINLQDQLIQKDIPSVRKALGIDLRAAVLKGRGNYLCPRRLENLRRRGLETADEIRVLAKTMVWLQETTSGDRNEININGPAERDVWSRISSEDEGCTTENCLQRTGGICPFYRARLAAQSAHILVVNHALLLADVATGNKVLPEYDYLIVDEAHHLEEATTDALSFKATQHEIERMLRELGGPTSGALGWALSVTEEILAPSDYAAFNYVVQQATDLAFQLEGMTRDFFEMVNQFLFEQREGRPIGLYAHQERILPASRTQPAWVDVEVAWEECEHVLTPLVTDLATLTKALGELFESLTDDGQDAFGQLSNLHRRMSELGTNLNNLVFEPDPGRVYWAEIQPDGRRLSLNAAPLHIGPLMQEHLWNAKSAVVLTSATLTAANEFDYLRSRLSAEDADELALGSPFDFESSALLYLVNDIPEPNDRHAYQRALEHGLIRLCQATGGRTLVLFTNYMQLRNTALAIAPELAKQDIMVYEQGEGASPHSLLETFRSSEKAVLLGTRAFWEGVDVPGAALSVLVIAKLPFDVPSDPIVAARAETFEEPFNQYQLPEAILKFRQGFGRLIRTQSDRGVVAVMDKRILSKRYGQAFLESLPGCTVQRGPLAALPKAASSWLNI